MNKTRVRLVPRQQRDPVKSGTTRDLFEREYANTVPRPRIAILEREKEGDKDEVYHLPTSYGYARKVRLGEKERIEAETIFHRDYCPKCDTKLEVNTKLEKLRRCDSQSGRKCESPPKKQQGQDCNRCNAAMYPETLEWISFMIKHRYENHGKEILATLYKLNDCIQTCLTTYERNEKNGCVCHPGSICEPCKNNYDQQEDDCIMTCGLSAQKTTFTPSPKTIEFIHTILNKKPTTKEHKDRIYNRIMSDYTLLKNIDDFVKNDMFEQWALTNITGIPIVRF